jgi:hypothetical protein
VENVALPPLKFPLPIAEPLSKNVTVPVAVDDETAAVNVTDCANVDGLLLETRLVLVGALFTACETAPEVLPLSLASPP